MYCDWYAVFQIEKSMISYKCKMNLTIFQKGQKHMTNLVVTDFLIASANTVAISGIPP